MNKSQQEFLVTWYRIFRAIMNIKTEYLIKVREAIDRELKNRGVYR